MAVSYILPANPALQMAPMIHSCQTDHGVTNHQAVLYWPILSFRDRNPAKPHTQTHRVSVHFAVSFVSGCSSLLYPTREGCEEHRGVLQSRLVAPHAWAAVPVSAHNALRL